ncbi:MAG: glycoside hydrolase family 88 protein [Acidobacteria bacterium]|nr:glycoside hydrolase family 88 protein [Acidobacteriota bacterium]
MAPLRLLAAIGLTLLPGAAQAPSSKLPPLPSKRELAAAMRRTNAYQQAHPVMKPDDRNWERATWYTGVMAAWRATHDQRYFQQALDWGRLHQFSPGTEPNGANRLFCSQTWIELYLKTKDPAMIQPTIRWLATPDPYSPAGQRRWYLEAKTRTYADSLYGAAAFALLARATRQSAYLDPMQSFFDDVSAELWDDPSGLFYRDLRYKGQRSPQGNKIFWSRGNGWVFAGIARLLESLPRNDPRRVGYEKTFRRMAAELLRRQPADGLWRASLDDPPDDQDPESSGSGFFCFGMAWGVNHRLLDRATYLPAISKSISALLAAVGDDGRVQWGQQVDHRPNSATRQSTHEYVTGAFLLAASEVYKLKR